MTDESICIDRTHVKITYREMDEKIGDILPVACYAYTVGENTLKHVYDYAGL